MSFELRPKCELCPCGCGQPLSPGQKHHADKADETKTVKGTETCHSCGTHEYGHECECECGHDDECGCGHGNTNERECGCSHDLIDKRDIIRIIIGAVIYAAGLIFSFPPIYELAFFAAAYLIAGGDVLYRAGVNIIRGRVFDENFLMSIATIGAFTIREYPEAVAVMLFYQAGELFQSYAVGRSKRSISKLIDIKPEYANLKKETGEERVSPESININDVIIIKPGERVPLDGTVMNGESYIDTSALTGESVPRRVTPGDVIYSGSINQSGLIEARVEKVFSESAVSRIIELVQSASSRKAKTENFISRFAGVYTPIVVGLAVCIALFPPLFAGGEFAVWLNRALIFLVISCPCALVISIPLGFFGGIGAASRAGVLVKGSNYLEALREVKTIVFDKTGTLTEGVFRVSQIKTFNGFSSEEVLRLAAYMESNSTHPIARSITEAYKASGGVVNKDEITGYEEISGYGVKALIQGRQALAGSVKLLERYDIPVTAERANGTAVYIAVDKKAAGEIIISDNVRPGAKKAIEQLKKAGIERTIMLTGDRRDAAAEVSETLGLDAFYAELLPEDKVKRVEELISENRGKVAFVGDGINDAPVLARADLGIAMGGLGSDAAIEAADVVIMDDEPSRLTPAISIARKTRRIVWQNIALALGVKAIVLALGAGGIATMWEAVFADVGVALLAVLNAMRAMRVKEKVITR